MATRTYARDSRGRFAFTDSRKRGGMTRAEKEALAANENYQRLRNEFKAGRASEAVEAATAAAKAAEKAWKQAQRVGGDAALEDAWKRRLAAHAALAKAMKKRERFGM